jgi:tetratricopeptide (TPR) repeat protein
MSFPYPHILRKDLLDRFSDVSGVKVILFEADAGYGKSVAAAELVQTLPTPTVWYPLEHLTERTPLAFVWNLIEAIRVVWPRFGERTTALLEALGKIGGNDTQEKIFPALLPVLVKEFERLGQVLWLVLENYHLISRNVNLERVILELVEHESVGIHFIITSRDAIEWSWRDHWEEQKKLVALGERELAFTHGESRTLAQKMGVCLAPARTRAIYEKVRGWPFLHHLFAQSCQGKNEEEITEVLNVLTHPTQRIHEYLTAMLLRAEDPPVRSFLCQTSILSVLDVTTCDHLLKTDNASEILYSLRNEKFLRVVTARGGQVVYVHSHEIIRDFLQHMLWQEYGAEKVACLYNRLGDIYQDRKDWERAISVYCQGQQFDRAKEILQKRAPYLISTTQLPRLATWLDYFLPEYVNQDPMLLMYRGVLLASVESPRAETYLVRAKQMFEARNDAAGVVRSNLELGWFHYIKGNPELAREALYVALGISSPFPHLKARTLHYLAVTLHSAGHLGRALHYAEQAIALYRRMETVEDKANLNRLLRHSSQLYHSLGRTQESVTMMQEAHQLAQAFDLGDLALAWTNNEWAMDYYFLGQFDQALAHLDEADRLLAPYHQLNLQPYVMDYVIIARGHVYQALYEYEQAEDWYRRADRSTEVLLAPLRLSQPGWEQEAFDLVQNMWLSFKTKSSVVHAKLQAMFGIACMGIKDYEQALVNLEDAVKVLEQKGAIYALMTARLYLAKSYFALDRLGEGRSCLHYTLSQMAKRNYYHLDIWQSWTVAEMCAQALKAGIETDFVERLVIKRLPGDQLESFFPLVNAADEKVRHLAVQILSSVGNAVCLEARRRLNQCTIKDTKERLRTWLDIGWLTEVGLIQLEQILSWRQLEIFLLWISPHIYGRIEQIAAQTYITVNTVNTHLRKVRIAFEQDAQVTFPRGRGSHTFAYDWAINRGIIDPKVPFSSRPS